MPISNNLMSFGQEKALQSLAETNHYTERFGLSLTEEDQKALLQERKEILMTSERVEFGEGILPKLIFLFCDSPYLYQDNYVENISRLQEIFYQYKNESMDLATDDELLEVMKEAFDGECEGALEELEGMALERFAREIRETQDAVLSVKNYKISRKWKKPEA